MLMLMLSFLADNIVLVVLLDPVLPPPSYDKPKTEKKHRRYVRSGFDREEVWHGPGIAVECVGCYQGDGSCNNGVEQEREAKNVIEF